MGSTDFRVLLKAVLDKSGINTELKEVQDIINRHSVDIVPELKTASLRNQIKSVSKDIASDFNKTFGTNLSGTDIFKAYENQAKQVIEQNKIVQKSFADLRKNTYQSIGDKSPDLQKMAEMYKQEAIEASKASAAHDKLVQKSFTDIRKDAYQSIGNKSLELQKMADMYRQEAIEANKVAISASKINQSIASGTNEAKIEQLTANFRSLGLSSEDTKKELNGVNSALLSLKNSSDNVSLVANAKALGDEYSKASNRIKVLSSEFKGFATESQRLSTTNTVKTWAENNSKAVRLFGSDLKQIYAQLNNPNLSLAELRQVETQFQAIKLNAREAGVLGKSVGDSFKEAAGSFTSWITISGTIMYAVNSLREMKNAVFDIDTAMTNLYKVSDETDSRYSLLLKNTNRSAQELGQTVSNLIEQTASWKKLGFSISESENLAKISSIYANVGEVDNKTAVSDLVTALKAFNLESSKSITIVDSLNKLGNEFATDAGSLGEGLKNAASALALGGMDINKSLALLTGGAEITQNAGELGNALKVGQMRVMGMKGALEELGEESEGLESISKIQTHILNITKGQVNIMNSADPTKFKDYYDILENVSKVYSSLDQTKQADLIETLFGKQRGNQGAAVIQAFQSGQVQKALEASINSAGSAYEEQSRWMESLEAKTQQYEASFQSLSQAILDSDFLKSLVDSGTEANNVFSLIIKTLGLFPTVIGAIGLGAFVKSFQDLKTAGIASTALKEFNSAVVSGTSGNLAYSNILKTVDTQTKINIVSQSALSKEQKIGALASAGLGAEEIKTAVSTGTLSTVQTAAKVSTLGFGNALKGLWATMLANPLLLLGMAITAGFSAWNTYKQSVEETRQATQEAASVFGDTSKSIDEYADKYKKLHDELVNTNVTEERQHEIKTDLLSLQKELNDKYGEEYGRINLVTDAYKDQTQAILDMNKAAAKNYLLENRGGIESATRKMEQDRTYSLGSTGSMSNDYAKQMYDIISQYTGQGVNLEKFNMGSETGYTIKFTGNAEQADKVIHDVASQIQELEEKFKDNNFVQSFLDNSANALKENNKVLDKYQEQYDEALVAQIASDDKLSEGYTNAKTAVNEYNDAVNSGDETKILSARKNLDSVKSSIDLTSDDWKRYGGIIADVFGKADTGLYDFEDKVKANQDGLKGFADELRGLSEEDLLSMADDGKTDSFDKLVESAKKYGLNAEGVIAVLERLNIVQGKLAKSGENAFAPISKEELITNLNSLSTGFESLDKIMDSMGGKNPFDYSLLDEGNFKKTFGNLGESYTQFIEKISSSPKDVKGAQSAFNDLVSTWIDSTGVLDNLTSENSSLATAMLKNMGVANAEQVVSSSLAATQEHLAAQKAYTADMSDALTNATASEITGLINEATQSDIARVAIAGLALEKANANGTALDTSGDIENVMSLIGVIGTASTALNNYNKLKSGQIFDAGTQKANRDKIFSSGFNSGQLGQSVEEAKQLSDYNKQMEQAKSDAQKEVDDAIKAARGYKGKGTQANATYGGGVKTNKAGSGKEKTKKEFSEIFDWVQIAIDRVNEKIEAIKGKISDATGWKAKNAITGTALDEMSTKVSALESQLNTYQGKLDEAGSKLNATYIDKIKNGTLEVETVTDEVISKNIKEYQDWYGKINDVNKELDDTKKAMQELAKSRLDNIINDFESLTSLMSKYSSYRKNLLDLQKSLGQEISNTDYEQLMNQQEAIYNQLQSEYSSLQSELYKAVSAGTIKAGSEEWRKYNGELIDINSSMNDAVSSMNDFRKALMDLPFEQLQMVSNEFDRINNGIGTMIDVMGSSGTTENGMVTAKGLAQIALYGKQYANAKQQAAEYSNAISALNEMYDNGSITQEEYNSKLSEYTNAQLSAVKATKEAEDAILQFRKTAIQEQIDDYNKLIEAKKKARDEDKSYEEYLTQIEEKQKSISTLQAKIDELSTKSDSSDRSAIATRLQLENDLVNARKDLAKTQSDYAYDQTTKSLDKQAEEYQNAKDKELNDLETSTDAQQKVIEDYLGQVKDNYKTVYNTLSKYGSDYNIEMTSDLVSPWESANTAVDTFQSAVSDAIAQINIDIDNLDISKLTEMVLALNGFSGGGNGSSFEDITGTGTWQKNKTGWWYGSSDEDYASGGIYTIGGKQYNFNDDGYMNTGWDDSSGSWRYFEPDNGQMVKSSWRKSKDGKDYYLTADGTMATDMAIKSKSGNEYYYVDDNGVYDGNPLTYDQVKKKNITVGYRNGTLNTKDELAYMDEDGVGSELINKQGTLMQFKNGDAVFDKTKTKNLWEFSDNPNTYVKDMILRNQMNLSTTPVTTRANQPINVSFSNLFNGSNVNKSDVNDFKVWATKELPIIIQQNMQKY